MRANMIRRHWRVLAGLAGVTAFVAMSVVLPGSRPAAHADQNGSAVTVTKTITDGKGKTHSVSLTVSQTTNLVPRQNVSVGWQGAIPTHNYQVLSSPTANNMEYPMVLMQCWGTDQPSDPNDPFSAGSLDPSHCETSDGVNNYNPSVYAGTNGYTDAKGVKHPNSTNVYAFGFLAHRLKFQGANGTWYNMYYSPFSNANQSIPLELLPGSIPLNARGEWSDGNGNRSNLPFEVRSSGEYPASGCASTQVCTLVAVPITDPYCAPTASAACTAGPNTPVGPGPGNPGANPYLMANSWWMATNWRNRLSVPLTFQPQHLCDVTDSRKPVAIDGSELASTALSYYWDPAFCVDPTKFKLQYINQTEPSARQALTTQAPGGYTENAILTSLPVTNSPRPVAHAPVLDTGFAVSFLLDASNNTQVTQLRLTPLLLAKLITQSYSAGSGEPALQGNPIGMFLDPEFLAVNPGLKLPPAPSNVDTSLIMPYPTQLDTVWALTNYINADPEARAWLNGTPDAYSGMVVNPAFRGYALPQLFAEIRDTWLDPPLYTHAPPPGGQDYQGGPHYPCVKNMATPPAYFTLVSQGVQTLNSAATALLNLQAPQQSVCDSAPGDFTYGQFVKVPQQGVGSRAMFALTSVAQAAEYLLPTAQLQVHNLGNGNRLFAGPTADSMAAALAYTTEDQASGVLSLDYPHLSATSYPGTVPVYAAIPTAGLDPTTANDYAQFLTFAATAGQTPGSAVGNLPPGYAPLPQPLRDYTLQVAKHVAAQDGQVPAPPPNLPGQIQSGQSGGGSGGGGGTGGGNGAGGGGGAAAAAATSAGASSAASTSAGAPDRVTTLADTRGITSWLATWGLPVLLALGLVSGVLVPVVRVAGQPGHPVRLWFGALGGGLAALLRRVFRR